MKNSLKMTQTTTLSKTSWVFICQIRSLDTLTFIRLLKKEKHLTHLQYSIQIESTNLACIGGAFLNVFPKNDLLFFDSFGFKGFRYFIIDNDRNIIDKLLHNLNNFKKTDKKVNLVSLKFSISAYEKLKEREISELTDTAKYFFHFLYEFARSNN